MKNSYNPVSIINILFELSLSGEGEGGGDTWMDYKENLM